MHDVFEERPSLVNDRPVSAWPVVTQSSHHHISLCPQPDLLMDSLPTVLTLQATSSTEREPVPS